MRTLFLTLAATAIASSGQIMAQSAPDTVSRLLREVNDAPLKARLDRQSAGRKVGWQ